MPLIPVCAVCLADEDDWVTPVGLATATADGVYVGALLCDEHMALPGVEAVRFSAEEEI